MIIRKVAAVILDDRKILVVRKRDTNVFIMPGGKIEPDETPERACRRELMEELGLRLLGLKYFGSFSAEAAFEDTTVQATVYLVAASGEPTIQAEIVEFRWLSVYSAFGKDIKLGSILSNHVIPKLFADGLM